MRALYVNNLDNNSNANGNNNLNNNARLLLITQTHVNMSDLYAKLCSYNNLELAFKKARKHKTLKPYVIEFEKNLDENITKIRNELIFHTYRPKKLEIFILRDPKTRKISKSDFRDRVVHHALCNIIEPIFEKGFIYDSYANRKGKGTLKAIERFDYFKRKVSVNSTKKCFVLKADIKHYFENVGHEILVSIIKIKINDERVIWLIRNILSNYNSSNNGKGMPLGNLTSQFFANVYLNELDRFVKHELKADCYIRYVDDFVIFSRNKKMLEFYKHKIDDFLMQKLSIELHPDKSRILLLKRGVAFLGLRVFSHHKILIRKNIRKFQHKLALLCTQFDEKNIDYDKIYDFLEGWVAYSKQANTYNLRNRILGNIEKEFEREISTKEINRHIKLAHNKNL